MDTVDLGALNLEENVAASAEGQKACPDYGREFAKKLGG
jgi:hypothetical protein